MQTREQAEQELRNWAANNARRDDLIRAARHAGLSKNRIHILTGVARTTIDRILPKETTMVTTTSYGTDTGDPREVDIDPATTTRDVPSAQDGPVVEDVDGTPGVLLPDGASAVLAEGEQIVLERVPTRMSPAEAEQLAAALLAVARHA